MKKNYWIAVAIGAITLVVMLACCVSLLAGYLLNKQDRIAPPTTIPTFTTPPAAPVLATPMPTVASNNDPLTPALQALGFSSREELITYFGMMGVTPDELHGCPGESACIAITREKDDFGHIIPFQMSNPTGMTFDGWRCAGSPGGQAKVPPGGPWCVEGVTLRPWK